MYQKTDLRSCRNSRSIINQICLVMGPQISMGSSYDWQHNSLRWSPRTTKCQNNECVNIIRSRLWTALSRNSLILLQSITKMVWSKINNYQYRHKRSWLYTLLVYRSISWPQQHNKNWYCIHWYVWNYLWWNRKKLNRLCSRSLNDNHFIMS